MFGAIVSRIVNKRLRFESLPKGKARVGRDVEGLHHVLFGGKNAVGRGTVFAGKVEVGYATTIGANNYIHGPLRIGNYCQLAPAVGIYGKDHSVSYTTSYLNSNLFEGRLKEHSRVEPVSIGHDVWIGHGAVILKGTHVGNGAVIGAGSVVTSSVPAFVVMTGNPARILRQRFSLEVINLLQQLEWWSLPTEDLAVLEPLFHVDFNEEKEKGISVLLGALERLGRSPLSSAHQRELVSV